ncbi:S49 family peptidase [Nitrospirillum sp. BR 11163]|uniref:S49 family peptidase n=1 Tax=Nitrospirillum sp. BR 11163 TaxID=3104323 RepID=UPI002AFE6A6F|nr:S49 family peptidase [Nitrospirillum sp. BR 11163]MEA1674091.1 S49 family peptidase [Nitrospirillum sp. BR 11163]
MMQTLPGAAIIQAAIAPGHEGELVSFLSAAMPSKVPEGCVALCDAAPGAGLYDVMEGVAVIGVLGVLVRSLGYIGSSWATGYDCLRVQIQAALSDPAVQDVALYVDSPGGEAAGCFELAAWMREAQQASTKRVVAIVGNYAYSAAYALASSTSSLSVPQLGGVGSIGVVIAHVSYAGMLEKMGIAVNFVFSGSHKVDGNPYQDLPQAVRDRWTANIDATRRLFCDSVAAGRAAAGATLTSDDAWATEALCFSGLLGTAEAVSKGLADAVMSPDDAFKALIASRSGRT